MQTLSPSAAAELFRAPPHRMIDVGEGEVAHRKVGNGPDVLFVHGWPVTGATFRRLLPFLSSHFTCHVIDLVGAGQSRFDRTTRIDLPTHVRSIQRVIDVLGLKDYAAVGQDSGGMLLRYAVAGDERLRGLALIDSEQPQATSWLFRLYLSMAKLPGFEHVLAWAVMRPWLRRSPLLMGSCFHDSSLIDGEFEEFFLRPLRDDRQRRWAAGTLIRNFDKRYVSELDDVHRRIAAPVKLVWGAQDPFFPVHLAKDMMTSFADASLHIVGNAKLFSHEEHPEEVAAAILPVLRSARPHADNAPSHRWASL